MSLLALLLSLSFLAPLQSPPPAQQSLPGIQVLKFGWDKQVVGWERDPFQRPIESHQDMQRQSNPQRRESPRRTVDADATIRSHQKDPARTAFRYKLTLKNAGAKTIKSVDWDYLFFDAPGGQVIGVHQFTSEELIRPGKSKQLMVMTQEPPARVVSAGKAADKELRSATGQVIVRRITYEDGSTSELPSATQL